ncbi:uncharacterized protein LOC129717982 [Wyeomyia smithii]|uniref:uncharacterized protein LOC129717982 n=1 Tax=Wyeomyia smithii TaxID=174621 RepID=UPI002467BCBA|nr:uncharacterized protein LOC129717982 [Wyeomyia smithii]
MTESSTCSLNTALNVSDLHSDQDFNNSAEFLDDEDSTEYITLDPEFAEICTEPEACSQNEQLSCCLPAIKRKTTESTFDFMISCYKKDFRGQHHSNGKVEAKVISKEYHVFGNSLEEVLEQNFVKSHIRQEVIVYDDQNFKRVKWADDADTEFSDIDKYMLFKDLHRKRTYRVSELQLNLDIMVKWRKKVIDVYLHVYSLAIANQKLYDLVMKLEAPDDPDRSGACSNESYQEIIIELKTMHPEVSADSFVWNNWAEHVEASPGYKRDYVKQNPDEIRLLLRPASNGDSVLLEENRRGLFFAKTITRAMEGHIKGLKEHSAQLSAAASMIDARVLEMEIQLKSHNEMLTSMQRSLAPVENGLSRSLAKFVTDAEDVDHM